MSTNPLLPQYYGPLYGSLYFAVVMSTAFYGVTCMQTFFYYVHYQNDRLGIKGFVAVLWVLNTTHEALTVSGVYKYIMAGLQNPLAFLNGFPDIILQVLFIVLAAIPTQGFFVYRMYILSGKNIVAPLIWVILATTQLVSVIIYTGKALYIANGVQVVTVPELSDNSFISLLTLSFSVAAGVDILIAIFMTFLLLRERAATAFASTANTLQRLTVFAVNTGIWPATFALLAIILLHMLPSEFIYAVFGIPLCSVYCNTLLANLNARVYLRGEATTHFVDGDLFKIPSPSVSKGTNGNEQGRELKVVASAQGICKTTAVETFLDANRFTTSENASV